MNKLTCLLLAAACIAQAQLSCNGHNTTTTTAVKDNVALPVSKDTSAAITNDTVSSTVSMGADSVPVAKLIVPGISIGLTHIGQVSATLLKSLGKPDKEDAAMGKSIATWYAKNNTHNETDIYSTTNMGNAPEVSRVNQIRVTSSYFMTTEKLGVGSLLAAVQKVYPGIKKTGSYTNGGATNYIYDAIDKGIAFEINSANQCIAVSVHPPKDKAFETYLGFFENYTPL